MSQFTYPTAAELREIEQDKLPVLTTGDPIFSIMPIRQTEFYNIMWEQKDNYAGLQGLRGLDGKPLKVDSIGISQYQMTPGVYGEFMEVSEEEITLRRQIGSFASVIDLSTLVMEKQDILLNRRIDRLRYIGWTTLAGSYSVASKTKNLTQADAWQVQKQVSTVPWTTFATATPLSDFRAAQLLSRGKSVSFRADATAYLNQVTLNNLLQNTNANDIAGRRTNGLSYPLNLMEVNKIWQGEALPMLEVYDEGYLDDTTLNSAGKPTFKPFIPDGYVFLVGKRRGATPGEYQMCRNINNPNMAAGAYTKVFDTIDREVPRRIEVHDGHNGGPALLYPGDVVWMKVY